MRSLRANVLRALVALFMLVVATPAHALPTYQQWTGLPGLNAGNGAQWIREYVEDTPSLTLYAATEGDGVWRSPDDGITWTNFSAGLSTQASKTVRTVYLSGGKVFAGTDQGLFASAGGSAFQPVAQGDEADPAHPTHLNQSVQAVISSPTGQILAGTFGSGAWKSTDGGNTWTPPAEGNGMPDTTTIWSFASLIPNVIFAATSDGVFRSIDFGSSWSKADDGIVGEVLRVYADGSNPNIFYALTAGDGVFRSVDLGLTWSNIDGAPGHELGGGQTRALLQYNGTDLTRLYVGTENGLYAGTTSHKPLPGAVTWRHISNNGLLDSGMINTIFWSLFSSKTTPGFIIAGTQSNGGYALALTPPVNTGQSAALPKITVSGGGAIQGGATLNATPGSWTGTPDIEFAYKWQYCTSTTSGSCHDIGTATDQTYVITKTQGAANNRFRVVVTASNDVPTFSLATANSAITAAAAADPTTLPGYNQLSSPEVVDLDNATFPTSGDRLEAQSKVQNNAGWFFNPAQTSVKYQWYRCTTTAMSSCDLVIGATASIYHPTDDDVTDRFCAAVTGINASGSTTTDCSGMTNTIFPQQATALKPPTVSGNFYVGGTALGNVGQWKYPGTSFVKEWMVCEPDGSDCESTGDKDSTYVPTADDLGQTLRLDVTADSNEANHYPAPVDVLSAQSAVITVAPPRVFPNLIGEVAPGGGNPGGGSGGAGGGTGGNPGGGGGGTPADTTPPVLGSAKLAKSSVKAGQPASLAFAASEGGTLSILVSSAKPGRVSGKGTKAKCKAGGSKGKKCTALKPVTTILLPDTGSGSIAVPTTIGKKKLAKGSYQLAVTPVDKAGNRGAPKTLTLKIK